MKISNKTFREKIKYLFLKYALIPIIMIFVLFFIFMFFTTKIRPVNDANKSNAYISTELREVYINYYNEIERMSKSDLVIDYIDTNINSALVYERFYNFNNKQKVKSAFHILNLEGEALAYTTPTEPYVLDNILKDIVPSIKKNPDKILTEAYKMKLPYDRYVVYTFAKSIKKDTKEIGYIIYQLLEEDIQKLIFVPNAEVAVVTDQYDRIIGATNNVIKGLMNKFIPDYTENNRDVKIKDEVYYMKAENILDTNINVYTLNTKNYDKIIFLYFGGFLIVVSLILYILLNYLAKRMSTENTESIDALIDAVQDLQMGNMESYVHVGTGDEFEILGNQYNIMLDKLNELMRKNEELSNLRRVQEVKQLQSQFNPHLIFNILEILKYTIVIDQAQAQDIIMTLSRLLRYSIRYGGETVLFEEDFEYIKDYLKLHKIRFKNNLTYHIQISQEAKKAYVPKLLLQAVIENSIKYGYRDKESLNIHIKGEVVSKDLIFVIEDDGSGMTEEQLKFIKNNLQKSKNETENVGLFNVHRRLVLLYGEDYGLSINSSYGEFTEVQIKLPYIGRDDYNDL